MLYLSHADTQRLDLRMTDVVPAIEEAFRRAGNGQAVVAARVRVVHPPLEKNSMGKGRKEISPRRHGVRRDRSLRERGHSCPRILAG